MDQLEQLLDILHLEDLRNEIHPSIFDENEEYDMLIIRLPLIAKKLDAVSMGFVFLPGNSYLYNRKKQAFEALEGRFDGPYNAINTAMDQVLKSFTGYQNKIEEMEELLYEDRSTTAFMTNWLDFKRDILRVERILLRASITVKEVISYYEEDEDFPVNSYADLHEHMDRTMRAATLQLAKLDYLYSFYNVRTNEKMNKMIYMLTIISAIFLPLNLVVGFFGMNTSGLPFADGTVGTLKAVTLMVSLMLLTSLIIYKWRHKVEKSS
ncbi:MAG: magnesium transporter [Helicobacteraceae bacterium]|jgi:magnesium transporter|nr:magnesium transporter [Helicobacteraceae bacterium]